MATDSNQIPSTKSQIPSDQNVGLITDEINPEDLDLMWTRKKCSVCGFVYEGSRKIVICPKCGNEDPEKWDDVD